MMHKILIVEDNPGIAELVQMHLKDIHCEADIAFEGAAGLQRFRSNGYELVILDRFYQGKDNGNRIKSGGLVLAIAKRIIDLHGGNILKPRAKPAAARVSYFPCRKKIYKSVTSR